MEPIIFEIPAWLALILGGLFLVLGCLNIWKMILDKKLKQLDLEIERYKSK